MHNATTVNIRPIGTSARYGRYVPWAALALVGLMGACSKGDVVGGNTKQIAGVQAGDGFLPQPDLLAHNEGTLWDLTYLKPGVDFHAYNAIMVDPVTIVADPGSKLAGLPPDQLDNLSNTFYADVFDAVGKSCKMATTAGPGVVRFHIALSDATNSNGAVKTVATYVPYLNVAYKASSLAFNGGVGYFAGTATAEAYATDGATNDLLWQGVDKRGGNAPLLQNTADAWLDVHNAFKAWAAQLVTKLEQNGICSPATAAPS
jgi:Protein of unknown function (DUF3313)